MSETQAISTHEDSTTGNGVGWGHYGLLALIIALGAVLRLLWLDSPAIWGDEAATWARTCGTFQELLEGNRGDGFVPLHYEMYWALRQWLVLLTPERLRLIPAIAGILMVPAMYFLARQLVRPGTALLVALLTATSAYFLTYSRDAKMYMQTWLFVALHVGFLLLWLRRGWSLAWWGWVACGVAAVGLHASAWLAVAVGGLMVFTTWRKRWSHYFVKWPLYLVGLAIMGFGPWYYYTYYNVWAETTGGLAPTTQSSNYGDNWGRSGIGWIENQTRGKTGPELVRDSATAFLYSYSRAEEWSESGKVAIPEVARDLAWGALGAMLIILAAGTVRWPSRFVGDQRVADWYGWQPMLWLGAWIILPTYGFYYCRSVQEPASPKDWLAAMWAYLGWGWLAVFAAGAVLSIVARSRRWVTVSLAWVLGLGLLGLVAGSAWVGKAQWYARIWDWAAAPWVMGALLALSGAVSWRACGEKGGRRWLRFVMIVAVLAVMMGVCEGVWWIWDEKRKLAVAAGREWHSIWMPRYLAIITLAVLIAVAVAIRRLPGRVIPTLATLVFVGINLGQYGARLRLDPEPRLDLEVADVFAGDRDPNYVVYVRDGFVMGSPGTGTLDSYIGRYYLALLAGGTYSPHDMRWESIQGMLKRPINRMHTLRWIASDLKRRPEAYRVVLWEKLSVGRKLTEAEIQKALGPGWALVSSWEQPIRRHWNWQDMDVLRRLEFARAGPMTRPTPELPSFP